MPLSASELSLTEVRDKVPPLRRLDPGLMPLPDTACGLEWSSLVNAAKAYEGEDGGASGLGLFNFSESLKVLCGVLWIFLSWFPKILELAAALRRDLDVLDVKLAGSDSKCLSIHKCLHELPSNQIYVVCGNCQFNSKHKYNCSAVTMNLLDSLNIINQHKMLNPWWM